jgi:alanyl-tRNA synthetase
MHIRRKNQTCIIDLLQPVVSISRHENISEQLREAAKIFSVSPDQLEKTLQRFLTETEKIQKTTAPNLLDASMFIFNEWKNTQKQKKMVSSEVIEDLVTNAYEIPGTPYRLVISRTDTDAITVAALVIKNPGYIVHIFDGKKLVSAASDDVDIDLRPLASELGKILGGSGGGKPKLTQCGGPKKENIQEAFIKAKERTLEKIKKE